MKKLFLSLLLMVSVCVACCSNVFVMGVFAAEEIVYEQNFGQTPVGSVPEEVTLNEAAAFTEDGYMHVIEKKEGEPDRALRINHQTSAKGTNTATITLPNPVQGAFRLDADFKFGSTVKREFTVYALNGNELFRVGIDSSKKRLYSRVGGSEGTNQELADIDFDFDSKPEYHFTFDIYPDNQSLRLTVDGNGSYKSTVIDLTGSGIAAADMGIASMKISIYFSKAVGNTGRFFQIDNITVRTKEYMATFDGNNNDTEPSGNTEIDVTVSLLNYDESASPLLLFALYDSENKLVTAQVEPYPAEATEGSYTKKLVFEQAIPENCRLKTFVWDNMTSLRPIGDATEF